MQLLKLTRMTSIEQMLRRFPKESLRQEHKETTMNSQGEELVSLRMRMPELNWKGVFFNHETAPLLILRRQLTSPIPRVQTRLNTSNSEIFTHSRVASNQKYIRTVHCSVSPGLDDIA